MIKITFFIIAGYTLLPLRLSAESLVGVPVDFQGIKLGPNVPPDVSLTQANRQRDMDIFSWNSFVALNWPDDANGNANKNRFIGKTTHGDHSTVWENWISTSDIFDIPAGVEPQWGRRYVPSSCSKNSDYQPGMKVLTQASKSDDFFEEAFDSGALIDQSGNFVRYEILINKDMFDTIKKNKLYDKTHQKKTTAVNFNCGDNGNGKQGAVMIKAAWKMMNATDNTGRYHTDSAMVFTPAKYRSDNKNSCEMKTIGLVGMHIVHKTVKQPQWIWSSFEQLDNLPDCENQNTFFTDPSKLNTPSCPVTTVSAHSFYSINRPPFSCNKPPPSNDNNHFLLNKPGIPSQLCRENALETSAPPVNKAYQSLLTAVNQQSVWANYALIGTQWNSNIKTSCETDTSYVKTDVLPQYKIKDSLAGVTPLPLANSTMESYEQGTSSCIQCHSDASVTGKNKKSVASDFVWFLSQELD